MSEIEKTRKQKMKDIIFMSLSSGGIFSVLIYILGGTAGPYVAVLLFITCCLISIGALIYGYIFPAINKLKNPMKNIFYGLMILVFCIIGFYVYSPLQNHVTSTYYLLIGEDRVELDKDGKAICVSVDDCLACYDFERARKLIDPEDYKHNTKKITIAESKYWADKGEIDKALTVIDESWGIDDSDWPEADWQAWKYNIIDIGVATCCEKSEFKQAKIYALKAADDINVDGNKIGETGWKKANGHSSDDKAKGPSMREALLKKISEYEKLLK